jgi:class 3 adenylate cyclase
VRDVEVRYAERDGKCLAYAVFGTGPRDLVVHQSFCPIDLLWDLPQLASFMDALATMARVIVFDQRGQGASDPIHFPDVTGWELGWDDLVAVLDAAGVDAATFLDLAAGVLSATFAAAYPQRVRSLIIFHLRSSFPELARLSDAELREYAKWRVGIASLESHNPRVAHDPELRRWWARARRLLESPEVALAEAHFGARIDVDAVLPSVQAPTLVLHRRGNPIFDLETSRRATARIPHSRFVELPGSENEIFLGETAPVLAEIERFLAEPEADAATDRVLATVLFTDIVASTEQLAVKGDDAWLHVLDDHDHTMTRIVSEYRGRVIRTTGDGVLATFDGPARAVQCAAELLEAANLQGITLRAGLHTGEIELRPSDIAGIAVHTASRIAALAEPGEILVSRTVVDLTAGSGLHFVPRGEHRLKGVPGTWPTFAAVTTPQRAP